MALLNRSRRVAPSEFTRHYYDASWRYRPHTAAPTFASILHEQKEPQAPPVVPRVPKDLGYDWSVPPHVNPALWKESYKAKLQRSQHSASLSQRTRDENKRVCEETNHLTSSHKEHVDRRLSDRLCDIAFWKEEVDRRHDSLVEDASRLRVMRDRLHKAYELNMQPLEVTKKCMEMRSEHLGIEAVEDEVETALRQELQEIDHCQSAIVRANGDVKSQLRKNLSCLYHLEKNFQDKKMAQDVDQETKDLIATASPCTVVPSQTLDPSPVTVDDWRNICCKLLENADVEHKLSNQVFSIGEDILVSTERHLRERYTHSNEAIQRRVEDTKRAKSQLEEQHSKIVEEECLLLESIKKVEEELAAKQHPLALSQTRLEWRTQRPNLERTRDDVEKALLSEVEELECTIRRLTHTLEHSRIALQDLRSAKNALEHDINLKSKTVYLDQVEVQGIRNTINIDVY